MRLTALDIHEQTFRVAFRGFDAGEVDAFLQRVADEMARLTEERDEARQSLEQELRARRTLEEALASARTVQEGMLEKARLEAEGIRLAAQARAERTLAEANEAVVKVRREVRALEERRALGLADLGALAEALGAWVAAKERVPAEALALASGGSPADAEVGANG